MKFFPSLMLAVLLLPLDFLAAAEPEATPVKELPLPGKVFAVAGRTAFVIEAETAPEPGTKAWVWYDPTLPRLPGAEEKWLFEQFLAAGIAIAGIDAGECYGSPDGRKIYTALYEEMTARRGFSKNPVLLGRSRGGLMTLSWAADHPDQVGGFVGIYPVCDLRSQPGIGKASGAYRMSEAELEANLAKHNPVDRLAQHNSIKGSSGLSEDEIAKAKRDAGIHAEEDKKRKESVEDKNHAETLIFQVEKQLGEMGDKLSDKQKKPITEQLDKIKEAVASNEVDRIKSATDELERLFSQAAAAAQGAGFNPAVMAGAGAGGPPDAEDSGSSEPKQAKGKVVDADFEVVNDDKKA